MLKPDATIVTKGRPRTAEAPAPARPAGPPQFCVLCAAPCHAVALPHEAGVELQTCPACGTHRRDAATARKAFA